MRFCDSRYSAQRSCAIDLIVVLKMQNIFVLFVPGYSAITICFSWTFICRDLQLAKDSHGGEADCTELVNP